MALPSATTVSEELRPAGGIGVVASSEYDTSNKCRYPESGEHDSKHSAG